MQTIVFSKHNLFSYLRILRVPLLTNLICIEPLLSKKVCLCFDRFIKICCVGHVMTRNSRTARRKKQIAYPSILMK